MNLKIWIFVAMAFILFYQVLFPLVLGTAILLLLIGGLKEFKKILAQPVNDESMVINIESAQYLFPKKEKPDNFYFVINELLTGDFSYRDKAAAMKLLWLHFFIDGKMDDAVKAKKEIEKNYSQGGEGLFNAYIGNLYLRSVVKWWAWQKKDKNLLFTRARMSKV